MTSSSRPYIDYPFGFAGNGRTATTGRAKHVRDMIYQVLFTSQGERVNLPDFGCGLLQLVFMPNSDATAAATQLLVHGALEQWLGDVIDVSSVTVTANDNQLDVSVVYRRRDTGERVEERFQTPQCTAP